MNATIDEWIMLALGVFAVVWGIGKMSERRKLLKTGIKVEGVVFKLEERFSNNKDRMPIYYPVIRYLTLNKEWITKEYESGTNPSAYKEGDIINVIYDPDDNNHFIIDSFLNRIFGFVLIIIGALTIAGAFVYYMLKQY